MAVVNNTSLSRYELVENEYTAYADYHIFDGIVSINYVFSPPALRGTGAAGRLMEEMMADIRTQNLKARPICGYAATWLQRHKEYNDLMG
jgi:predicted GNAT family acetyltransferase